MAEQPKGEECRFCRFCLEEPLSEQAPFRCRRYPQRPVAIPNHGVVFMHPVIGPTNWCGEFADAPRLVN
mgnify:CR=1 FL=1|jgi:hypothetical protein